MACLDPFDEFEDDEIPFPAPVWLDAVDLELDDAEQQDVDSIEVPIQVDAYFVEHSPVPENVADNAERKQ
jgi:hypothetical protein